MNSSNVKRPFALAEDRLAVPIFGNAINVQLRRTDHEVHMVEADVASSGHKFLVVEFFASRKREPVGTSNGNMTGRVFIE